MIFVKRSFSHSERCSKLGRVIGPLSFLHMVISGCGITQAGNPGSSKDDGTQKPVIAKAIEDHQVSETIGSQVSNTFSLLSDSGDSDDSASLSLWEGPDESLEKLKPVTVSNLGKTGLNETPLKLEIKCSRDEEKKQVVLDGLFEKSKEFAASGVGSKKVSGKEKRVFKETYSHLDEKTDCNLTGNRVRFVKGANLVGLELEQNRETERVLSRAAKWKDAQGNMEIVQLVKKNLMKSQTKARLVAIETDSESRGIKSIREQTMNYEASQELLKSDTLIKRLDVKVEATDFKIETVRAPLSVNWSSKTILSGKLKSTISGGGVVNLEYQNLKFSADSRCKPIGGAIQGTYVSADGNSVNFNVLISDETGSAKITYEGLEPEDTVVEICIQ